jgi:glycosyltransferase involved in cell wall biosynthesis
MFLKKLAIISSHPIQYNAPLFALLAEKGEFELKVFYTWGEDSMKPKFDPDFGKVIEWDIPLLKGYSYQFVVNGAKKPGSHHFLGIDNPGLVQDIESWGAEVVWIWGWSFKSHLLAMRYFSGKIPVWFRGDSVSLSIHRGVKSLLRRVCLKWVYSHVDFAFHVGEHNKNYYLENGLDSDQLVLASHAVDNDRFFNTLVSSEAIEQFRASLGFSETDFVILFAGKLEPRKNPFYLKEIWNYISFPNIKLLIVGNGPLENELKSVCKNDDRIQFLDFQNQTQMPKLYKSCNALILPSVSETWGLAMNEAMASGIPVLASENCGGAIDLIQHDCGFIFPLNDAKLVANIIEKWYKDKELFVNLKNKAQERIKEFSYEIIVKAVNQQMRKQFPS